MKEKPNKQTKQNAKIAKLKKELKKLLGGVNRISEVVARRFPEG